MSSLLSDWPLGLHSGLSSALLIFLSASHSYLKLPSNQSDWLLVGKTPLHISPSRRASFEHRQDIASFARPQGSSELAHALCQQAAGSAGESCRASAWLLPLKFFRTGIWVLGITRLLGPEAILGLHYPMESQGGVIWNCQGISYFTVIQDMSSEEMEAMSKGPNAGSELSLFVFISGSFLLIHFFHFQLTLSTTLIHVPPFSLGTSMSSVLLYLQSVTLSQSVPHDSRRISLKIQWKSWETVCSTLEEIATPVYWLGRSRGCCPYTPGKGTCKA